MNPMKELREELKLSMKEAAQSLGLPYTTYVNYEKGAREPNFETLILIAQFYNTTIDYLIRGSKMYNFSSFLKDFRRQNNMSQQELADRLGTTKQVISNYEIGKRSPKLSVVAEYAEKLNLPLSLLLGEDSVAPIPSGYQPMPEMVSVPLVGRIACGDPITAEENLEGHVSIPAEWHASFTLMCAGASMEPSIHDGDLVAIRSQPTVENGQIAAVRIDNEATLKRVYLYGDHIELRPENPEFPSIIKIGEDMNNVHIEGKAVGLCRGL